MQKSDPQTRGRCWGAEARPDRNTGPGGIQPSVFLFRIVRQRGCRHSRQLPPTPMARLYSTGLCVLNRSACTPWLVCNQSLSVYSIARCAQSRGVYSMARVYSIVRCVLIRLACTQSPGLYSMSRVYSITRCVLNSSCVLNHSACTQSLGLYSMTVCTQSLGVYSITRRVLNHSVCTQ